MKSKEKRELNLAPLLIIVIAAVFISFLLLAMSKNPIDVYKSLIYGAFGSGRSIISTLTKAIPICFAAFAVSLSKKAGIFNIGVEGQLVMGAIGSAAAGIYLQGLPAIVHVPVALLCGVLFGMAYAFIPTQMFVRRKVNLLVIFILMNNVASLLSNYAVVSIMPDKTSSAVASLPLLESSWLPNLITSPSRLNISILILFVATVAMYIFYNKTVSGYKLDCCGNNKEAAHYAGINVDRYALWALLIGGALAGLAGAIEVQGTYHRLYDGFSPGYGFDGIPIALLANNNPLLMVVGSILFGALRVGLNTVQMEHGVPAEMISVIQGTLVVLIACEYIIRRLSAKITGMRKKGVAK